MHKIRERLFIASLHDICKIEQLISKGVTHILTVDSQELSYQLVQDLSCHNIRIDYVPIIDEASFNLLDVLESALEKLTNRKNTDVTVVHCLAGVSRSASVIIAYLMKTENLSYDEALQETTAIKQDICPNPGFQEQLRIFEKMGNTVDVTHPSWRRYVMDNITTEAGSHNSDTKDFSGIYSENLEISDVRCKNCRTQLLSGGNIRHFSSNLCSSIFLVEPETWMDNAHKPFHECKCYCPKCGSKLGFLRWYGTSCSCGEKIRPSFQIHRNRVDFKTDYKAADQNAYTDDRNDDVRFLHR